VQSIEVISAVSERVELGSDDPSPLTVACALMSREFVFALLNGGCDVDWAARCTEGRHLSALALACIHCRWRPEWRGAVEFLCLKVTLGKADFPPGERHRSMGV
jgi:hypothetical protein